MTMRIDPEAMAARFVADNAGHLETEGKLAFARRARLAFEAALEEVGGVDPAQSDALRDRFLREVLARLAGLTGR